jgi:lambda family phage tail tape measure protein
VSNDRLRVTMELDDKGFVKKVSRNASQLGQLSKAHDRYGKSAKKSASSSRSFLSNLKDTAVTLASLNFLIPNLSNVLFGWQRSIVGANAELERSLAIMKNFSNETTKLARDLEARNFVDIITEKAANAPFSINAITDTFVKMKAGGIDPLNGSMNALIDGVASFGGTDDVLKRASVAIQQMGGKGVVSMEELRQQLGEAIPNAINIMASSLGVTYGELVKQISEGNVAAEPALTAMFREMEMQLGGAAARMMTTWNGLMAQMSTQFTVLLRELGEAGYFQELKDQLTDILALLKTNEAKQFVVSLGQTLKDMIVVGREVVEFFIDWGTEIKALLVAFVSFKGISAIFTGLNKSIIPAISSMSSLIAKSLKYNTVSQKIAANGSYLNTNYKKQILLQKTLNVELGKRKSMFTAVTKAERASAAASASASASAIASAKSATYQTRAWAMALNGVKLAMLSIAPLAIPMLAAMAYSWSQNRKEIENNIAKMIEFNGVFADLESLKNAKEKLELLKEQREGLRSNLEINKELNEAEAQGRREAAAGGNKYQGGQMSSVYIPSEKGNIERLKEELANGTDAMDAEIKILEGVIANGMLSVADAATKSSQVTIDRIVQLDMNKARIAYKNFVGELEEIRENAAKSGSPLTEVEFDEKRTKGVVDFLNAKLVALQKSELQIANSIRKLGDESPQAEGMQVSLDALGKSIAKVKEEIKDPDLGKLDETLLGTGTNGVENTLSGVTTKILNLESVLEGLKNKTSASGGALEAYKAQLGEMADNPKVKAELIIVGGLLEDIVEQKAVNKGKNTTEKQLVKIQAKVAGLNAELQGGTNAFEKFRSTLQASGADMEELAPILAKIKTEMETFEELKGFEKAVSDIDKFIEKTQQAADKSRSNFAALNSNSLFESTGNIDKYKQDVESLTRAIEESTNEQNKNIAVEKLAALAKQESSFKLMDMADLYTSVTSKVNSLSEKLAKESDSSDTYYDNLIALSEKTLEGLDSTEEGYRATSRALNGYIGLLKLAKEEAGGENSVLNQIKDWGNYEQQITSVTVNGLGGFVDTLVDGMAAGKLSFSDFANSVIQDLQKMILKMIIFNALQQIMGGVRGGASDENGLTLEGATSGDFYDPKKFAKGGIMGGAGEIPLNKYSRGGIATQPQLAMFGEGSVPEAYVPLPDGRSIPVTMKGGNGGGEVQVNIFNQGGEKAQASSKSKFDGEKMIIDVFLKNVSKPGPVRESIRGVR